MKVLIPRPGSGLPCPPVPTVVLPPLTCSRPPYLRRSGRRSCCLGGDPDGDATVVANKSISVFLSFWPPALLPIILTVCRCFNKYVRHSTGRHPPGPPATVISGLLGPRQPRAKVQGLTMGAQGSPSSSKGPALARQPRRPAAGP